jgi:MscS family membrane protein
MGPVRLLLMAFVMWVLARGAVSILARNFWIHLSSVLAVVGVGWTVIHFGDVLCGIQSRRLLQRQETAKLAGLSLARRAFNLLVIFVAAVWLLKSAGVNVSAVLAGFGIGGIALALAAQRTLEDVFGGVSIIMRNAIRVGDSCKIADETGIIEDISLGSTRIRTLDRATVTIPNARVSQSSVENYASRDSFWFHHVLGLRCDTPARQLRELLKQVTDVLRADTRVEAGSSRIRFVGVGTSSLNVEISAYVRVKDYVVFLGIQEELLLRTLEIIESCGATLAMPVQFDGSYKAATPSRSV